MVKLVDLIFISIPEAIAISYFIWLLLGRINYIDHKKIILTALTCATMTNASFEAINNLAIKAIYQILIVAIVYYIFYNLRISQTLISVLTLFTIIIVTQLCTYLLVNDILMIKRYFTNEGAIFYQFYFKSSCMQLEVLVFFISFALIKAFKFTLFATTQRKEYDHVYLAKFLVAVFSIVLIILPEFWMLTINHSLFEIVYLAVNTIVFVYGMSTIAYTYLVDYLKACETNTIQKYQLNRFKEKQREHDELIENAPNVVELSTIRDKNT